MKKNKSKYHILPIIDITIHNITFHNRYPETHIELIRKLVLKASNLFIKTFILII